MASRLARQGTTLPPAPPVGMARRHRGTTFPDGSLARGRAATAFSTFWSSSAAGPPRLARLARPGGHQGTLYLLTFSSGVFPLELFGLEVNSRGEYESTTVTSPESPEERLAEAAYPAIIL